MNRFAMNLLYSFNKSKNLGFHASSKETEQNFKNFEYEPYSSTNSFSYFSIVIYNNQS